MKVNVLEQYPNLSPFYQKVFSSERLKDILDPYNSFPDLTQVYDNKEFEQFNTIDKDFLLDVDQIVIKCRDKDDYFDEMEQRERIEVAEKITKYINNIIALVSLMAKLSNEIDVKDIANKISARLSMLLPNNLKKMIKISKQIEEEKYIYDKVKRLTKLANSLDLKGDYESSKVIDQEINNTLNKTNKKDAFEQLNDFSEQNMPKSYFSPEVLVGSFIYEILNWLMDYAIDEAISSIINLIVEKGYNYVKRHLIHLAFVKMFDDPNFDKTFLEEKGWISLENLRLTSERKNAMSDEEKSAFKKEIETLILSNEIDPLRDINVNDIFDGKYNEQVS